MPILIELETKFTFQVLLTLLNGITFLINGNKIWKNSNPDFIFAFKKDCDQGQK